jgi:hypothetical protein
MDTSYESAMGLAEFSTEQGAFITTWHANAKPFRGESWELGVDLQRTAGHVSFNGRAFDIENGQVFVLTDDLQLHQVDAEAGRRDDSHNLRRLSNLL